VLLHFSAEAYLNPIIANGQSQQPMIPEAIENIEHANALWKDRRQQVKRMKNYRSGDHCSSPLSKSKEVRSFLLRSSQGCKDEI